MQTLLVHVVPNASCSAVAGHHGDALKIRVNAPPTEGRANAELLRFLAERLRLPRGAVRLARGVSARRKMVEIDGYAGDAALALVAEVES